MHKIKYLDKYVMLRNILKDLSRFLKIFQIKMVFIKYNTLVTYVFIEQTKL